MKAQWPTFGTYLILYNAERSGYPWRECIHNALKFSDHVHILECHSEDDTYEKICEEFKDTPNIVLKRSATPWDMEDMCIVGKKKQEAREMVRDDYCVYLDADEILSIRDYNVLLNLVLDNPEIEVFSVPYVTFFGSPYQIANFKDAENFWRWKIFRNQSYIGHGVHGAARKFDENGRMYMDKKVSDGCELIHMQTLDVMPSLMFMPQAYGEAGSMYRAIPTEPKERAFITTIFSEVINDFPIVCLHYGWVNFRQKAKNAAEYWTKTKAYRDGMEHSNLFDALDPTTQEVYEDLVGTSYLQNKEDEWHKIDTIPLHIRNHPDIIKPRLATQMKPKILTVSLSDYGSFGVPNWNHALRDALSQYDVQNLAFENYVSNSPPNTSEIYQAQSFINWMRSRKLDENALVLFADGFWAATYDGPAKVVSVIHGLWSHPLRDKWDDGLLAQRQELFAYQLNYYKNATKMGHTLICISPFIHKILKDEHGVDSILIPNAVNLELWDSIRLNTIEKDRPLILHGITSVNKGLDILKQVEEHPLIKDKFDIGSIDEIAKHADVAPEIAFKAADIAFLPTKWEASSYLLLECLANNLPIVAYRAGILNCNDLHRMGSIGTILTEYDVDKFAEAIVETYENRIKYRCGRLFLQENDMTTKTWDDRMRKLIFEVL